MMRNKKIIVLVFFILFFMVFVPWALAGVINVEKEVEISGKDLVRVRKEAVSKGLQEAVLTQIKQILQRDPTGEELAVIDERIINQYTVFIRNYRITGESSQKGVLTLVMEVFVDEQSLQQSLTKLGFIVKPSHTGSPSVYLISLSNINSFQAYQSILNYFNGKEDTVEINLVKMAPGLIDLEVETYNSLDDLTSGLSSKSFKGFKVILKKQDSSSAEFVINSFE